MHVYTYFSSISSLAKSASSQFMDAKTTGAFSPRSTAILFRWSSAAGQRSQRVVQKSVRRHVRKSIPFFYW